MSFTILLEWQLYVYIHLNLQTFVIFVFHVYFRQHYETDDLTTVSTR